MGKFNFNQHTEDNYEISPALAKQWLEHNRGNRGYSTFSGCLSGL